MLSSVGNYSFQQFHSSPASFISSHAGASNAPEDQDSQQRSPVPDNSQKVNPAVNSQESQASKKEKLPGDTTSTTKPVTGDHKTKSPVKLNDEELKEVQELKQRDIEVRAHEAAHLAAAGQYAQGGAKFTLQRGPDGRSYAIGGSVSIDTSPEPTPEATIRKAEQIKRAALAPAEPSGQDRSVAAQAVKLKLQAEADAVQERRETGTDSQDGATKPDSVAAKPGDPRQDPHPVEPANSLDQAKAAAKILCEICSGDHPTGPHLEANQQKTAQYVSVSQG